MQNQSNPLGTGTILVQRSLSENFAVQTYTVYSDTGTVNACELVIIIGTVCRQIFVSGS
jgi:hypothetical protein